MATNKCTMLFQMVTNTSGASQGNRIAGWSESVYYDSDESLMRTRFENLCLHRALVLGAGTSIIGQRYQKINPVGRAVSADRRFPGRANWPNDLPQVALTFTMFSSTGLNSRRFTLRGLPDQFVTEGELDPTSALTNSFRTYCNQLSYFSMRARRKDTAKAPLVSVAVDGTFVLQQPLAFVANDYVQVSGVKVLGGTSGGRFHIMTRTDDQHGKFSNWTATAGIGGFAQLDEIFYPTFEDTVGAGKWPTTKVTVRKAGRPFGGFVGRASKRA